MIKDKYYAISLQGKFIESNDWEELKKKVQSPNEIEMFVAFFHDKPYVTSFKNEYYWPQIQIINHEKKPILYQRGALKVKRVKVEASYYFKNFQFDLENCLTQELLTVYSAINNDTSKKYVAIDEFYHSLIEKLSEENKKISETIY